MSGLAGCGVERTNPCRRVSVSSFVSFRGRHRDEPFEYNSRAITPGKHEYAPPKHESRARRASSESLSFSARVRRTFTAAQRPV